MKIGVLAVQGAFIEHIKMIENIANNSSYDVECIELRQSKDLNGIDALVLPGGESTVQGKLLHDLEMFDTIQKMIQEGIPTLATCAGLILLAQALENDDTKHLSTLPVKVKRNAYGRQLGSFEIRKDVGNIKDYPHVFIRAPFISDILDPEVKVLSTVDEHIVGVEYKNQIGFAFHPEMTDDDRIHRTFIEKI